MSRLSPALKPCQVGGGKDPAGSSARPADSSASDAEAVSDEEHEHQHELRTDHLLSNIGQRSLRGGVVMYGAQAVKVLAQFGSVVVLVRLLPPAAFGLIAMTAALYAVLDPLRDLGLSAATIQKPDLAHAEISTLFWCNLAAGTTLALALVLCAPLVADFYHEPELTAVTRWVALGLLLNGFCSQHWALLRRQMRFGAVAALETSAELLGLAVALALALGGAGYWALVAQRLVGPTVVAPGCWILCRWRPSRPAFAPGAAALLGFGSSLAGTSLIALVSRSIDMVLIGWFWGATPLGFYDRANKLLISPLNNIMMPLYSIGMPTLSRLVGDEIRYRRAFGEMIEKLAMITMPGAAAVVATSDWTTAVLFGSPWKAAAPLVAWLALIAGSQPVMDTCALLYMTQMRPRELLRAGMVDAALRVLVIACSLPYGVEAVAAVLGVSGLVVRAPVMFWLAARRGPVALSQVWGAIMPSILAACSVVAAVCVLRRFVLAPDIAPLEGLAAAVPTALLTTLVVFWLVPKSRQALHGLVGAGKLLWGGT